MEYLNKIETRLDRIEHKVDNLVANQQKIKFWIVGDEDNELSVGALEEIVTLKTKVAKLEKMKERVLYLIIGMSLPAGVGIGRILEILRHIH